MPTFFLNPRPCADPRVDEPFDRDLHSSKARRNIRKERKVGTALPVRSLAPRDCRPGGIPPRLCAHGVCAVVRPPVRLQTEDIPPRLYAQRVCAGVQYRRLCLVCELHGHCWKPHSHSRPRENTHSSAARHTASRERERNTYPVRLDAFTPTRTCGCTRHRSTHVAKRTLENGVEQAHCVGRASRTLRRFG